MEYPYKRNGQEDQKIETFSERKNLRDREQSKVYERTLVMSYSDNSPTDSNTLRIRKGVRYYWPEIVLSFIVLCLGSQTIVEYMLPPHAKMHFTPIDEDQEQENAYYRNVMDVHAWLDLMYVVFLLATTVGVLKTLLKRQWRKAWLLAIAALLCATGILQGLRTIFELGDSVF